MLELMAGEAGRGRRGLRREPPGGWPLDDLLVGVATLRTLREFLRLDEEWSRAAIRAWDACLMNGVSAQGAADAMRRIEATGLARQLPPERHWKAVRYQLVWEHPLAIALEDLFRAERAMVAPAERARRRETLLSRKAERQARERAAWEAKIRAEKG